MPTTEKLNKDTGLILPSLCLEYSLVWRDTTILYVKIRALWTGYPTYYSLKIAKYRAIYSLPFLYCLYVDELLDQLSTSKIGSSISNIYCAAPMYADDLALVAGSQAALQSLLHLVDCYAKRWRHQLNSSKSVIMVFAEATRTRVRERCQRVWHLVRL